MTFWLVWWRWCILGVFFRFDPRFSTCIMMISVYICCSVPIHFVWPLKRNRVYDFISYFSDALKWKLRCKCISKRFSINRSIVALAASCIVIVNWNSKKKEKNFPLFFIYCIIIKKPNKVKEALWLQQKKEKKLIRTKPFQLNKSVERILYICCAAEMRAAIFPRSYGLNKSTFFILQFISDLFVYCSDARCFCFCFFFSIL